MPMTDALVRCEHVSKKFCRDLKKSLWYGVTDSIADLLLWTTSPRTFPRPNGNPTPSATEMHDLRPAEFWANKDVSFHLRRGECLGLIGRNGAGKTTLLKMLNGLIKPDEGRIEMHGRVGALIALGAGFNPVLTGRENAIVNGAVLGLSRYEIQQSLKDIIEFAELEEFIDTPVRNYSSGMQVRLGFAVAAMMIKPDVLILDEVLAVGDAGFRAKCYSRIDELMSNAAVILVSHSMEFISQCCSSVGLMNEGHLAIYEDPHEGIGAYNEIMHKSRDQHEGATVRIFPPIIDASVVIDKPHVPYGAPLNIEIHISSTQEIDDVDLYFSALDAARRPVMCWYSRRSEQRIDISEGDQTISVTINPLLLHDGTYTWNFFLSPPKSIERLVWITDGGKLSVTSTHRPHGNTPYLAMSESVRIHSLTTGITTSKE